MSIEKIKAPIPREEYIFRMDWGLDLNTYRFSTFRGNT